MGFGVVNTFFVGLLFAYLVTWLALNLFVRPFIRFNHQIAFITTLALSIILESAVSIYFGVNVKSLGSISESLDLWGVFITPTQIVIILSALLLLGLVGIIVHCTPLGRRIRAIREGGMITESLGINRAATTFFIFYLATALAMYCGILVGYESNIQPTMGAAYTMKAFAAMILGGLGNIWGTVIGSYFLGLVENLSIGLDFGSYSLPAGYKDAFAYLIILIVLLARPQGIMTRRRREV